MKTNYMSRLRALFALCFIVIGPVSCATNPVTGTQELMLLSESDELRLGKSADAQIAKAYGLYQDPALSAYIQSLGKRLAALSHRPDLTYHFRVLDSPVVNAFAVPGGYVYVTRGILAYLNSEAELAGVLGHEIGHITARHSAQQYTRAQLAQLGLGVGSILSPTFREVARVARFGVGLLFLKFSRDNERQADDLGVAYAVQAGFDARRLAGFFSTLERLHPYSEKSELPSWFSTHPNPPERIRRVTTRAGQWEARLAKAPGSSHFQVNRETYLAHINGLVFGEDPRQGYLAAGVFYHPELRFQFPVPSGWKLTNAPSQVRISSPRKDAAILFSLAPGSSLKTAAARFAADSRARILESRAVSVSGLPAHRLVSDMATEQGLLRVLSYFIEKNRAVFVFHGFSAKTAFQAYASAFSKTAEGFKDLTDPRRLQVQPARIRIQSVTSTKTLRQTLTELGVSEKRFKDIALLNARHLDDIVAAGTGIKLIE